MIRSLERTRAEVRLGAIQKNLSALTRRAHETYRDWRGAVPMVKCNAYGHGLIPVVKALEKFDEAFAKGQVLAFGVATLDEAVALRKAHVRKPIWLFSNCSPWSRELAKIVRQYALTPVLYSIADLKVFLESGGPFHLKFNTGMNRLGVGLEEIERVRALLDRRKKWPEGICTHFATADDLRSAVARRQVAAFTEVVRSFSGTGVSYIHGANTSAALNDKELRLGAFCNVIRPGIGLYGYTEEEKPSIQLRPALVWRTRVLASRLLERGDVVGYGAVFRASRQIDQCVIAAGYGDGVRRALSNQELMTGRGETRRQTKVLGRVSMDLTALELKAKPGAWVTLLGNSAEQGHKMAVSAGTSIYEILTGISSRVPRYYL